MSHYPVFGGPHNQALQLAPLLAKKGWSTTVLLPEEPGNAKGRLQEAGIEVISIPLRRARATLNLRTHAAFFLSVVSDIRRIRRIIRQREIDVVVLGGLINPHAAIAARLEGVPVVWQILDTRTPALVRVVLGPVVSALADNLMFCGETLRELHGRRFYRNVPADVYFPPVDMTRFRVRHGRSLAREKLGIADSALVFGTVANINPQKGIEFFVRAAARILRDAPNSWFVVVGSTYSTHASYAAKLDEEIRASALPSKRLVFVGGRTNVEDYYAAFDAMLITSVPRSEGLPTTAIEAMAAGLPVVATDVGALREVVADGKTGFIVPALDSQAIANACVRLAKDGQLRKSLGKVARVKAEASYSLEVCANTHVKAFEGAIAHNRLRGGWSPVANAKPGEQRHSPLVEQAVCPLCHGRLAWLPDRSQCEDCGQPFPIIKGIPCLVADLDATEHDETHDHHSEDRGKRGQREFFDTGVAQEFETIRPHGSPRLYGWLLSVKLRWALSGLAPLVPGRLALTVCGGSGMDAEFLAKLGARVIASDLSLGAALRTAERARRYGLDITPIVADVERLPFPNRSVDLVLVHDGLHHLPRPRLALLEISRVAEKAVSITEPARAGATDLAIRLGIAQEFEEAGNRVERFRMSELTEPLSAAGFEIVDARRYAMYYRHVPGFIMRTFSRQPLFMVVQSAFYALDGVLGRFGNKVAVQARRTDC